MSRSRKVFRDGKVHVKKSMCETCIFRPGNLMRLRRGRRKEMVRGALRNQSCIPCHETLGGAQSICAGFFNLYSTAPLQIAERLGYIEFD